VGLTVALFVANEAFSDDGLQAQAKFGAVLSVLCSALAWIIHRVFSRPEPEPAAIIASTPGEIESVSDTVTKTNDGSANLSEISVQNVHDFLVEDVIEMLRVQRR